ncbi:MAG TPA: squalene/phytoene synthase family protein [Polyangiaceae bacterium]|nr:squalene/phytoene synthase family protein [Polyangiaceae bacterium]
MAATGDEVVREDEAFCAAMLPRVSRTFALGIAALPEGLRLATTAAYLLCRVADSIEDQTAAPPELRRRALAAFRDEVLAATTGGGGRGRFGVPPGLLPALPAPLGAAWPREGFEASSGADDELVRQRHLALSLFARQPADVRRVVGPRVVEMSEGMAEFLQGAGASYPVGSFADLERYCYFVAGTVGHMLTGLFAAGDPPLDGARLETLRETAERFGIALQLVNIVKDAAGDLVEGRCFVPRELWPAGLPYARLPAEGERGPLRAALVELADRARPFLADAQRYLVALPPERPEARAFCALALHLALLTLKACRGAPHLADPARPVKVSRPQVADVVTWLGRHANDDEALARRFDELAG